MYKTNIDCTLTHTHTHTHKHKHPHIHIHTHTNGRRTVSHRDRYTHDRPSVRHLISLVVGRIFRGVTAGSMWFVSRFGEFFSSLSRLPAAQSSRSRRATRFSGFSRGRVQFVRLTAVAAARPSPS
uniref:Uncharacterized protein n=1 Tax=Schizaphis graminum TaxID=13262 RepID=A0A2S2P823_SCHGA